MKINSNYNYSYQHIKEMFAEINEKIASLPTALIAGDNITIADGVISATDTKYTAGTGISISDENVISASGGGGSTLYAHTISFRYTRNAGIFSGLGIFTNFTIYTDDSTPFTFSSFSDWLQTKRKTPSGTAIGNTLYVNTYGADGVDFGNYIPLGAYIHSDDDSTDNYFDLKYYNKATNKFDVVINNSLVQARVTNFSDLVFEI